MEKTIWDLVIQDMKERDVAGWAVYGKPLTINNGKDMLLESYYEKLDEIVYLRTFIEEYRELNKILWSVREKLAKNVEDKESADLVDLIDPFLRKSRVVNAEEHSGHVAEDQNSAMTAESDVDTVKI